MFLLLEGLTAAAYGAGLIDASRNASLPAWLPQSFAKVSYLDSSVWGWIWASAGVLLLAGFWWRRAQRYLFAVAVVVNGGWAATFLIDFVRYGTHGYWAPGVGLAGTAAGSCSSPPGPTPAGAVNANPDLVASVITALVSLVLGVLSFIGASRAGHHESDPEAAPPEAEAGPGAEVLGDAYGRAVGLDERALAECEREADRLRTRLAQPSSGAAPRRPT